MVTLLSIVDDRYGQLIKPLNEIEDRFFDNGFVVSTPATSGLLMNLLEDFGMYVSDFPKQGMAQARRDVIEFALDMSDEGPFFYCDLDRLFFWMHHYPDELRETIKRASDYDHCVIGRTEQALDTHPYLQRETERIMNEIVSLKQPYLKLPYIMDIFAGARMFSLEVAQLLLKKSKAERAAIDYEWPRIAIFDKFIVHYIEVNGLAYESEFLDIVKSDVDEIELRIENLRSVKEFVREKAIHKWK